MTPEEWRQTPFPYKVKITADLVYESTEWLADQSYLEWHHWNKVYMFSNRYQFEFRNEEVYMLFKLRWQ
jgi:hypothetical protein